MSRRQFAKVTIRDEGQVAQRYRLTCGSCGCGEALGQMNFGDDVAQEQVPQKFEAKGWAVGKRQDGRDDRCPSCVNRDQERRRAAANYPVRRSNADKQRDVKGLIQDEINKAEGERLRARELARRAGVSPQTVCNWMPRVIENQECVPMSQPKPALVSQTTPIAAVADKPRQPTRDERRVITSKLEDVYLDEKAGYSVGWNDARVASDLGVPRAWVSEVREFSFGPGMSEELERALSEARAVAVEAAEFRKAMDALTARGAEILKRADAIERTTKWIETAVR